MCILTHKKVIGDSMFVHIVRKLSHCTRMQHGRRYSDLVSIILEIHKDRIRISNRLNLYEILVVFYSSTP